MARNFVANPGVGGNKFAADEATAYGELALIPASKIDVGAEGEFSPVNQANPMPATIKDMFVALLRKLESIANPLSLDQSSGRVRVVLDPAGGAQTLGTVTTVATVTTVTTVTTVATVTNVSNVVAFGPASAGISAASLVYDAMHSAWANSVRPRIT